MVVLLQTLMSHLQVQIVQKMELWDFVNFQKSNHHAWKISAKVKKIVAKIEKVTIENCHSVACFHMKGSRACSYGSDEKITVEAGTLYVHYELVDELCQEIAQKFKMNNSTAKVLHILSPISCRPSNLSLLIQSTKAIGFHQIHKTLNLDYLKLPLFKSMPDLRVSTRCDDETLTSFKGSRLRINATNISALGVNRFFKEWCTGKREITKFQITRHQFYGQRPFEVTSILLGINYDDEPGYPFQKYLIRRNSEILVIVILPDTIMADPRNLAKQEAI